MSDTSSNNRRLKKPTHGDGEEPSEQTLDSAQQAASDRKTGSGSDTRPSESTGRRSRQDRTDREVGTTSPRGYLRDDDIESKSGNYILSFGFPGSGKTTFQSFLVYYLTHKGDFDASPKLSPEETAQGWDSMALFNEWTRLWRDGRFPPANPATEDDISEFLLDINPRVGGRPKLQLGVLEASGELMTKIMADRVNDPHLSPTLYRYMENPNIRMTILLFLDPDAAEENDILFQNLFSFLETNFPNFENRFSLGVLVSKPESALRMIKQEERGYGHYARFRGELVEHFIERYAPRTYRIAEGWPKPSRVQYMTLYLGETIQQSDGPRLARGEYDDVERIFKWLYLQFTGEPLEPKWWQKAVEWLKQ